MKIGSITSMGEIKKGNRIKKIKSDKQSLKIS